MSASDPTDDLLARAALARDAEPNRSHVFLIDDLAAEVRRLRAIAAQREQISKARKTKAAHATTKANREQANAKALAAEVDALRSVVRKAVHANPLTTEGTNHLCWWRSAVDAVGMPSTEMVALTHAEAEAIRRALDAEDGDRG